jgi:hypothetical protein
MNLDQLLDHLIQLEEAGYPGDTEIVLTTETGSASSEFRLAVVTEVGLAGIPGISWPEARIA